MPRIRRCLAGTALLLLVACSGGGGDDDDPTFLSTQDLPDDVVEVAPGVFYSDESRMAYADSCDEIEANRAALDERIVATAPEGYNIPGAWGSLCQP